MPASAARFFAKVYSPTGATYRQTIDSGLFLSAPKIVREVGKPAGTVDLALGLPWDDFGYGSATGINRFDLVKVYAVNRANRDGLLVYQGHVTEIVAKLGGAADGVTLKLFSLDALLGLAFFKNGASFTKSYAAADVDTMFSDVISHVNSVQGATFFTGSLGNPGLSITADFVELTHLAALQRAASFLDSATWRWRINASGVISLAQWADATADHKLAVGRDVLEIEVRNSIAEIKNGFRLGWGGTPTYAYYEDATSKTSFGVREYKKVDSNIGDSGSADSFGDGEIARQKDAKFSTRITVSPEYAIETILPGDTVTVGNLTTASTQMLSGVKRIVRTEYDGAICVLHLDDPVRLFGTEMAKALS